MLPKFILYSDQIQGCSDAVDHALTKTLVGNPRIGFVPAATDARNHYFQKCQLHYAWLGFPAPELFDVEQGLSADELARLFRCDAIHLGSGDPLHFGKFLTAKGLMPQLRKYAQNGGVLIGVSAGAMLFSSVVIDPMVPLREKPRKGMALLPALFYPHFDGDSATTKRLAQFAKTQGQRVFACHDSEGVVLVGEVLQLIGDVVVFEPSS